MKPSHTMLDTIRQSEAAFESCHHCGLPTTDGARFCCAGCEAIYATIHSLGLDEYYRWKRCAIDGQLTSFATEEKTDWLVFDSASQQRAITVGKGGRESYTFEVIGIHCAGCVWLLERLPQVHTGIDRSVLNATTGRLSVTYDAAVVKRSEIAQILASLGYPPRLPGQPTDHHTIDRRKLLRLGVAGFSALNTMMLAVSLFQGLFSGIEPAIASTFRWLSFLISLPAITWAAWPLYRNAYSALRVRALHIELPLSLAIIAASVLSIYNTILNNPYVYYDSVCALIFFLLLGRTLQERALNSARRRARIGWAVLPAFTLRKRGDDYEEIPLDQLEEGDTICVKAGERIPADGVVVCGASAIDRSTLTGESFPEEALVGSPVLAGTLNISQEILIAVTATDRNSRLGLLLDQIEQRSHEVASLSRITDRIARWYVYVVLLGALVTTLLWGMTSVSKGVEYALTLLIVTCPCALAFATPTIIGLTIGEASHRGILIKSPAVVELLAKARSFYFDKTGTLTTGVLSLNQAIYAKGIDLSDTKEVLASLTTISPFHPVSKALRKALQLSGGSGVAGRATPGRGVEVIHHEAFWRLGSHHWMEELSCTVPDELQAALQLNSSHGSSCQILTRNDQAVALFALGDTLRSDVKRPIIELGPSRCHLISGDGRSATDLVARQLGFQANHAKSSLLPPEKGEIVDAALRPSVFIGDGVNDVAALSKADVGIALTGGLEPTLEAADVVITSKSLDAVTDLHRAARRSMRLIYLSLILSLAYNLAAGTCAVLGYINPLIAAILMPTSSLLLVASMLLFRPFGGDSVTGNGTSKDHQI